MPVDEVKILDRHLKELTKEISRLETEIETADPKLRETYAEKLKDIQHRRRSVRERMAKLRLEQALSWEKNDFAVGVERVLDRLGRGLDRLTTRKH